MNADRVAIRSPLALATALLVCAVACSSKIDRSSIEDQLPLYSSADLEVNKRPGGNVSYAHELKLRPPFYSGKMPLRYRTVQTLTSAMGGLGGRGGMLAFEFDDFRVYFVDDRGWPSGAVAVDRERNVLLAEAKITFVSRGPNELATIEMTEYHYSRGELTFTCRSRISNDLGFKVEEYAASGSKRRDYFFIMPFGLTG